MIYIQQMAVYFNDLDMLVTLGRLESLALTVQFINGPDSLDRWSEGYHIGLYNLVSQLLSGARFLRLDSVKVNVDQKIFQFSAKQIPEAAPFEHVTIYEIKSNVLGVSFLELFKEARTMVISLYCCAAQCGQIRDYEGWPADCDNEHNCVSNAGIDDCRGILPRIQNFDIFLRLWEAIRAAPFESCDLDDFRVDGRRLLAHIEQYLSSVRNTFILVGEQAGQDEAMIVPENYHEQQLCLDYLQEWVDKFKQMWWFNDTVKELESTVG